MAAYQLQNGRFVLRVADSTKIPLLDQFTPPLTNKDGTLITSADFDAYKAWVAGGGVPDPAPDPATELTGDDLDAYNAKAYPKLQALKTLTPAQVQTWVNNNVTDLASAKDAIKTLAVAVSILARRI